MIVGRHARRAAVVDNAIESEANVIGLGQEVAGPGHRNAGPERLGLRQQDQRSPATETVAGDMDAIRVDIASLNNRVAGGMRAIGQVVGQHALAQICLVIGHRRNDDDVSTGGKQMEIEHAGIVQKMLAVRHIACGLEARIDPENGGPPFAVTIVRGQYAAKLGLLPCLSRERHQK